MVLNCVCLHVFFFVLFVLLYLSVSDSPVHFNYQKDTLQRMARTAIVPVMILEGLFLAVLLPLDVQWDL